MHTAKLCVVILAVGLTSCSEISLRGDNTDGKWESVRKAKSDKGLSVSSSIMSGDIYFGLSIDRPYRRQCRLTEHLTIQELRSKEVSPLPGAGKGMIIPIPWGSDRLLKQEVFYKGRCIYSSHHMKYFYLSPCERLLLMPHWLHSKPFVVLDVVAGTTIEIAAPLTPSEQEYYEEDGHDFVYPFSFVGWDPGTSAIVAHVSGTCDGGPLRGLVAYRDTWRIDPRTGKCTFVRRQTQEWEPNLTWPEEPPSVSSWNSRKNGGGALD